MKGIPMSMLLDLGLFLRENNLFSINKKTGERKKVNITTAMRGFLFTLACRIGSDPYTWVSQETLADELDIKIHAVKILCKKATEMGLIDIDQNAKDKRKNLYKPASFLINYTQKRRENLSTISGFGIFWEPKKVSKRIPNNPRKVSKRIPTRYSKEYLISSEKQENNNNYQLDTEKLQTPKGHTTTITSKQPELDFKFYPNPENQKLADQIGNKIGKTGVYLIRSFINKIMKPYKITDDLDKRFKKFLLTELPAKRESQRSGQPMKAGCFLN
ncbi:MAG TPA: hypothetical protein VK553_12145 [Candidatus Nitrosopolaris rasttigaisensis]|nr:hypothetical protein [Candidatus Nitrosopolaris rasttigaisensis]